MKVAIMGFDVCDLVWYLDFLYVAERLVSEQGRVMAGISNLHIWQMP